MASESVLEEYGLGVQMTAVVVGAAISSEITPPPSRWITVVTPDIGEVLLGFAGIQSPD